MKHEYQNETAVSKLKCAPSRQPLLTGAKARTRHLLLSTALNKLEEGWLPSITELAKEAGVARATAYRYFPTQSALVSAVVDESLGPILSWQPTELTAEKRMSELLSFAYPRMLEHEGALRATLQVSLQQWAEEKANKQQNSERLIRGHRKKILALATEPLQDTLPADNYQRLQYALSLVYGSEIFMVLKDIWDLDSSDIDDVTQWMAKALINQAQADAEKSAGD
ncbi:TetR/AcrR family transcriptional regulator [Vibrio kasasachensis]|uniref:TetR/AcrR family transcriptional regulator n=1 Tax=Vibrio kasasachensis TaxID=2910248 RepID=UPI003D0AF410